MKKLRFDPSTGGTANQPIRFAILPTYYVPGSDLLITHTGIYTLHGNCAQKRTRYQVGTCPWTSLASSCGAIRLSVCIIWYIGVDACIIDACRLARWYILDFCHPLLPPLNPRDSQDLEIGIRVTPAVRHYRVGIFFFVRGYDPWPLVMRRNILYLYTW